VNDGRDNLIPLNKRTKDEQREITSKGGKASGKARRERKSIREGFNALLSAPVKDKDTLAELKDAGADKDAQGLLLLRIYQKAVGGDMQAAKLLLTAIGEADPAALEIAAAKIDIELLKLELAATISEQIEENTNLIEALQSTAAEVYPDYSDTDREEENDDNVETY